MIYLREEKSVLCEEPMGMNADQNKNMISLAKSKSLFLMEGVWIRFIPSTKKVMELTANNQIGEIKDIQADFGFNANLKSKNRLSDNKLGGGFPTRYRHLSCIYKPITFRLPKKMQMQLSMKII